jgi:hypothetical protein
VSSAVAGLRGEIAESDGELRIYEVQAGLVSWSVSGDLNPLERLPEAGKRLGRPDEDPAFG